jgi:hypothetical protein
MPIVWRVNKDLLDPDFLKDIEGLLIPSPYTWYVTYGFRTFNEQKELYKKYLAGGPKAAPPGLSPHEYGLAVDIVPDVDDTKPGLQPDWITSSTRWLWLFAKVLIHPRLKSGKSFQDDDHVERLNWKKYKK